jgi:hypothetical protein
VGKPKEREREREREREILLASGKIYQQQHYNIQQENTSNSTQHPHNSLPWKTCQVCIIVRPTQKIAPWKMCPQSVVQPCCSKKNAQNNLNFCALLASKFVSSSPCTDPYSTTSNNNNNYQHTHTKIFLGKCTQLLPTFLSQALLKISQSPLLMLCLAQCPMHSLIIRK